MPADRQPSPWIKRSSFIGKLYLLDNAERIPVSVTTSGLFDVAADDWLQSSAGNSPAAMLFHYHSQTPERLHYTISLLDKRSATLDVSRNQYLGFYAEQTRINFFKLQPLEWNRDSLRCLIRDHQGHKVKRIAGAPADVTQAAYLTVGDGVEHEFMVVRID